MLPGTILDLNKGGCWPFISIHRYGVPFSVLGLGLQWEKNSSFSSPGAHILDGKTDKKHASEVTPYIARIYGGDGGVCDVYVC